MSNETMQEELEEENVEEVKKDTSGEPTPAAESELSEVETLQAELQETKDKWLRSVAEIENLRKRAARDQAETRRYAAGEFARDLIAVCENLYRALDSMPAEMLEGEENKAIKTFHEGVDMTRSELLRAFEKHGLKRIMPERGEVFDHNIHQAVSQVEDDEVESGTVAHIIQAGYQMHDRLLQPAMVAVAKSAGDTKPIVDTNA